jgi:hypothetical protein
MASSFKNWLLMSLAFSKMSAPVTRMEPLCVVTRTADLVEGVSTIGHYSIDKLSKFITGSPSSLAPQVRVGRFRLLAIAELDNYSTSIFGESEDNDKHYMKWMRSMAV